MVAAPQFVNRRASNCEDKANAVLSAETGLGTRGGFEDLLREAMAVRDRLALPEVALASVYQREVDRQHCQDEGEGECEVAQAHEERLRHRRRRRWGGALKPGQGSRLRLLSNK